MPAPTPEELAALRAKEEQARKDEANQRALEAKKAALQEIRQQSQQTPLATPSKPEDEERNKRDADAIRSRDQTLEHMLNKSSAVETFFSAIMECYTLALENAYVMSHWIEKNIDPMGKVIWVIKTPTGLAWDITKVGLYTAGGLALSVAGDLTITPIQAYLGTRDTFQTIDFVKNRSAALKDVIGSNMPQPLLNMIAKWRELGLPEEMKNSATCGNDGKLKFKTLKDVMEEGASADGKKRTVDPKLAQHMDNLNEILHDAFLMHHGFTKNDEGVYKNSNGDLLKQEDLNRLKNDPKMDFEKYAAKELKIKFTNQPIVTNTKEPTPSTYEPPRP